MAASIHRADDNYDDMRWLVATQEVTGLRKLKIVVLCDSSTIDDEVPSIKAGLPTVYPKKYAHGFVVLCFVVVMPSFIMNSHEVFIHIHQGCFANDCPSASEVSLMDMGKSVNV